MYLKDGSAHEVLVPRVYAVVRPGALRGDGALISGRQVKMAMSGALLNEGGTVAGRERTEIDAKTLANLMGRVGDGGRTKLAIQEDLLNIGGSIRGGSVAIDVGRDFASITTTRTNTSQSGSGDNTSRSSSTNIDRQASVTATDGDGTLSITTGRDTLFKGSVVENHGTGETAITTGRHLTADTVQTREERESSFHHEKKSWLGNTSTSGSTHTVETKSHGTQISGAGDVSLGAGFGIAKDGSFAGVEGRSPSEALAGLTDQNSPLAWGAGFDPAGAGVGEPSSGNLTLKNATITSGGKTTLKSTGTTTFADDTETTFSQTTSSDVGLLWQKQRDTGVHKETAQSTTITAAGGSSTSAAGGVVTETPTPADKTWNDSKGSLTPTGQALVGIAMTAAVLASGGTLAGVLGITNAVGAAALNAGAMSFATQMTINTINNKGDVGKALENVSGKQIAVATAAASLSAGVISHISPGVTPRLDSNFKAGAGAGTKLADMGTTQSASFANTSTQATSVSDWAQGFASRLPVHGVQTITNVAASAVLADGDPSAIGNAALGSLATMLGTEASLGIGQAYHGTVDPATGQRGAPTLGYVPHKLLHGVVGAGTAAISGGNVLSGAAGAMVAEIGTEAFVNHKLSQGPITEQQAKVLTNQGASLGRVLGGLSGFAAGGDPTTGANTGGVAVQNNALDTLWDVGQMGEDGRRIVKGLQTGDSALVKEGITDLILDTAAALAPGVPAGLQKLPRLMREGAEVVGQKLGAGAAKEVGEKAATKVDTPKPSGSLSAEQANAPHIAKGNRPPYEEGTRARDIILKETDKESFVRVHGKKQAGEWIMRKKELELVKNMSPDEAGKYLKDKFALPEVPTHVSKVEVPAGTKIRVGKVAPQEGWGTGGRIQYEMEKTLPIEQYGTKSSLEDYLRRITEK